MFDKLLNIIGFNQKAWESYNPIKKNRFFFMYFKNTWLQITTFLFLDLTSLLLLLPISLEIQFIFMLLFIPGLIVAMQKTSFYKSSQSYLSTKIDVIIGFIGIGFFVLLCGITVITTAQVIYVSTGSFRLYLVLVVAVILFFVKTFLRNRVQKDICEGNFTKRVIANKTGEFVESKFASMPVLSYLRQYSVLRLGVCSIIYFNVGHTTYLWALLSILPTFFGIFSIVT